VKTFAIQELAELAQDDQTLRPEVVGVCDRQLSELGVDGYKTVD
jgi:hypothetical protein